MANDENAYLLRPEAGPVPYDQLQWRAKAGLRLMIRALRAAAGNAEKEQPREGHAVDTNRTNQIFFVSGEPGSGKSTLYLTLREMLSSQYDRKRYRKGYPSEGDLNDLEGKIRWLDPIDLEVAGDEGENLLAAVLVRINRVLEDSQSGFSSACTEAIKDLSELAADIGMAWEGNLQARGGELDPDMYSMEVMRAQRARLGVNKRLREALNKLAKEKCHGCDQGTLFVLPVDDFYLKPAASLQLLRLLRMISVPRLFFLVMGDITTVEALFVEKALADWTAVAGPYVFAALPDRSQEALGWARELRARFLRKLLPPGQRADIEPMDWYEAMKFKPQRLDIEADELRALLAQVDFDTPWTPDTTTASQVAHNPLGELLDFLTCRRIAFSNQDEHKAIGEEKGKEKEAREAYTGLQILDATPREIMDLWTAFREFIRQNDTQTRDAADGSSSQDSNEQQTDPKTPQLLSLVVRFVKLAIEEQNFLDENRQRELSGVLPTRRYYAPDTYLEIDRLMLGPESSRWRSEDEISSKTLTVHVRKHSPWSLTVRDLTTKGAADPIEGESSEENHFNAKQETRRDPFAKLPPRPTAWIILLHDLAWQWSPESMSDNLIKRLRKDLTARINHPELNSRIRIRPNFNIDEKKPSPPEYGWAVWRNGAEWSHFTLPEFETFQELDRFLRVWNSGLDWWNRQSESPETNRREVDDLVNLWALAGWTVLGDHYDDFARRNDGWPKAELNILSDVGSIHTPKEKAWLGLVATFRTNMGVQVQKQGQHKTANDAKLPKSVKPRSKKTDR